MTDENIFVFGRMPGDKDMESLLMLGVVES